MPITRAALRRLCLALPRSSGCSRLARPLHVTARRPNSTGPTQYATDLPAENVYHDFFPCTLHYYSWRGSTMAMHGSRFNEVLDLDAYERENFLGQDCVRIQEDGLVYPGPEGNDPVWNGALLMAHAMFLMEITENYHDCYEEQIAAGRNVPEPYFFIVPKGLRIPSTLLLAQKYAGGETFELMPRIGMPLSALNRELNKLFSSSACSKLPWSEYFEKYPFLEAYNNSAKGEWMSK